MDDIMDIDVEPRRLAAEREGATTQRAALATLRADVAAQTSLGRASAALRDQYEADHTTKPALANFRSFSSRFFRARVGAFHQVGERTHTTGHEVGERTHTTGLTLILDSAAVTKTRC